MSDSCERVVVSVDAGVAPCASIAEKRNGLDPALFDERALLLETELQLALLGTPNQLEAVQAAFGERAAKFDD